MTALVLVVLGGIWAAVIIVPLARARREGRFGDSISMFRRHLSVLERAAPAVISPANRLREPAAFRPRYQSPAGAVPAPAGSMAGPGVIRRRGRPYRPASASHQRQQMQRRRRDVLLILLTGMVFSLLIGVIRGFGIMLVVHVVFDALFLAYLVLLVRSHKVAAERHVKLRYLPRAPGRTIPAVAMAARARVGASGYGDGIGYGLPASY